MKKQFAYFDACTYLSLFQLPPKDLEELEKLAALIDTGRLEIFLSSQVQHEFRRRRAGVIAERLKPLREARRNLSTTLRHTLREFTELRPCTGLQG